MITIVWKDIEAKIDSPGMVKFWGIALFILFLVFVIASPGPQRVGNSFIPKLFLVTGISEFFIFLLFTIYSTTGNSLVEEEKTIRDLILGGNFSVGSVVWGKLISFLLHFLILLVSTLPFNLASINLGINGDMKSFYLIMITVDISLSCWGFFISTFKEKLFGIILLWAGIAVLLILSARLPHPWNLINPLILIVNSKTDGLFYYLFIGISGLILTCWRATQLRRSKDERAE